MRSIAPSTTHWLAALAAAWAGVSACAATAAGAALRRKEADDGGVPAGPSWRRLPRRLAWPGRRPGGRPPTRLDAAFLEALVEQLPVSVFVVDAASREILAVNAHAEREFGFVRGKVTGRTPQRAFGPVIAASTDPAMARALSGPEAVDHDVSLDMPTGTRIVSLRHVALRGPDGAARALVVVARDVTAQRRAERELSEARAQFTEVAAAVEDSLFITDPERSRFPFVSPGAFETWGLDGACALGDLLANVVEEDQPVLQQRVAAERAGQPVDVTVRVNHPVKGLRWLRSRTRSRRLADGQVRVYGWLSDVTAERRHELDLQRARDEAEAASQAKSQFMAAMSHEIRTPMNGILGMTELLLGTGLDERQRRFAQAVYRSGESLLEIINDILDFSKIEAGRLELAPCDFTLRGVVEDTLELLAPRAHEKGLELSFREERPLPAVVHADPLRLRQVLTNLVANAIKFTESGEVAVHVRQAAASGPGRMVLEFGVHDTGIGIEAEVLPRLFTAFTQANGGMSRRYGGTGLGLAISRQLVELMGGHIEVRSAPGCGSQFSFTLPVRVVQADSGFVALDGPAGIAGGEATDQLAALRVLVVEDHATNRTVLENMLGAWGMHVTLAQDGAQALEILWGRTSVDPHFDLALVDMRMPRLDGLAMARSLRDAATHPHMKLILLSSLASPDDVHAAQEAGFHRFLAKPVRKAELRQALLGVTQARPQASALRPNLDADILVIEDNPVNQEVMGQMLRRLGCRVRLASTALDGLRTLEQARFDLVMMDIQMPGMDGIEALGWFRRGPRQQRFRFATPHTVPVIAVTANALEGDEERFLGLGFDDYLSKPFRQNQLFAMLSKRLTPGTQDAPPAPADPARAARAPAAGAAEESAVLDPQALARLRELDPDGHNRLMERVVQAFDSSVQRLMPQLEDARRGADLATVRHIAHTLKSSSASVGAVKLSRTCADIEAMIRLEQPAGLDEQLDRMTAEVDIVLKALKCMLGAP